MSNRCMVAIAIAGQPLKLKRWIAKIKKMSIPDEEHILSQFKFFKIDLKLGVWVLYQPKCCWNECAEDTWKAIADQATAGGFSYSFQRFGEEIEDAASDYYFVEDFDQRALQFFDVRREIKLSDWFANSICQICY